MKKTHLGAVAAAATVALASAANASTYVIDVVDWAPTEFFSFGDQSSNPVHVIDLGVDSVVTGVTIDLSVTAAGDAWLSEFGLAFLPVEVVPDGGPGLLLTPGAGQNVMGTEQYTMNFDLNDNIGDPDAPQPFALPSGMLHVEAFDWDPDWPGLTDIHGSITIHYAAIPAPGALALLGLAGLVGARRRRNA